MVLRLQTYIQSCDMIQAILYYSDSAQLVSDYYVRVTTLRKSASEECSA